MKKELSEAGVEVAGQMLPAPVKRPMNASKETLECL